MLEPLFTHLPKAEGRRAVIQKLTDALAVVSFDETGGFCSTLHSSITVMDEGASQWQRKWMELGARCTETTWQAFADLSLSRDEIQARTRRTNRYSIAKGEDNYNIELYDSDTGGLAAVFDEFHKMHRHISGRETRNQKTWDLQEESIRGNSDRAGYDFVVFIRDRKTDQLAGAALFASTPQTGLYCSAAYDRERFSKPVGHIVQAAAMDYMRRRGIRWYEIGERTYMNDNGSSPKLENIGKYKEGFATHLFPRIVMQLSKEDYARSMEKR